MCHPEVHTLKSVLHHILWRHGAVGVGSTADHYDTYMSKIKHYTSVLFCFFQSNQRLETISTITKALPRGGNSSSHPAGKINVYECFNGLPQASSSIKIMLMLPEGCEMISEQ